LVVVDYLKGNKNQELAPFLQCELHLALPGRSSATFAGAGQLHHQRKICTAFFFRLFICSASLGILNIANIQQGSMLSGSFFKRICYWPL
jgi:hypothetical protein